VTIKAVRIVMPENGNNDIKESIETFAHDFCSRMQTLNDDEQRSLVDLLILQVASYDPVNVIHFNHEGATRCPQETPMKLIQSFGRVNDITFGALVTVAALGLLCVAGLALYAIVQMAPGDLFSLYA